MQIVILMFEKLLEESLIEYRLNEILLALNSEDVLEEGIDEYGVRRDLDWYKMGVVISNEFFDKGIITVHGSSVERKLAKLFKHIFRASEILVENIRVINLERGKALSRMTVLVSSIPNIPRSERLEGDLETAIDQFKPKLRLISLKKEAATKPRAVQQQP